MPLLFEVDESLVNAMIEAGEMGFKLGNKTVKCVGITRIPPLALSTVSGIIGITGRVNGSLLVNMSEIAALRVISGMLMTECEKMTPVILDGVAEVTNVIAGRLKSSLASSGYPLENITLPTVMIGQNYLVTQTKGMATCGVTLLVEDPKVYCLPDRIVQLVFTVMADVLKPSRA